MNAEPTGEDIIISLIGAMGFLPDMDNCVLCVNVFPAHGDPHFNVSDKRSMYIDAIHNDNSTH